MPNVTRQSVRMDCTGLDITHPIDKMPQGSFPYIANCRVVEEGRLESRPGYSKVISLVDPPNSIRRLNDPSYLYSPEGYTYVGGGGNNLYAGTESTYTPIKGGLSGFPLSLIPFRPDQSPNAWMYVYDANLMVKVRPDGVVRSIGVSPPSSAPSLSYSPPANVDIVPGQSSINTTVTISESDPTGLSAGTYTGINIFTLGNVTGFYAGGSITIAGYTGTAAPMNGTWVISGVFPGGGATPSLVQVVASLPGTTTSSTQAGVTGTVPSNWTTTGASSSLATTDRTNSESPTISSILYDQGVSGWCCIVPSVSDTSWMQSRMKVILSNGPETVLIRDVNKAITQTSLTSIHYDSGTTGSCSMTLWGNPSGLSLNSLIQVGSELVKVRGVILSPDGSQYSIRASTVGSHASGETVVGLLCWYCYTTLTHASGESIVSSYILVTQSTTGTGSAQAAIGCDASRASGRLVDPANDYIAISIWLENPQNVTSVSLLLSLDPTPNYSFLNPGNSYIWTLDPTTLQTQGASNSGWVEIIVPISSATRNGANLTRTLADISGAAIQMISTGACNYGFDWWYAFGTYGPTIQTNSPVGMVYQSRFRDSGTGAKSVPGPLNRQAVFPLREGVIITPATTTQAGVDEIDIYRMGNSVSSPLYVASVANNNGSPQSYIDGLPDSVVTEVAQAPDLTVIQPWPILQNPLVGTGHTIGTSVIVDSGFALNLNLLSNTVVLINGVAFQTYGQPRTSTYFEITQDAGNVSGVTITIASPTLAAQPLPVVFGPLEGPFAPVVFGLGDKLNAGTLYFTNFSDLDSASDANTLELTSPSTPLVAGGVWNGLSFCGSRDILYCIRYSYLTTIGATSTTTYQWYKVSAPSGIWSRWACCSCPMGLAYLGRDGIYIATDAGAVNITDEKLYGLFPHEGQPASPSNTSPNLVLPVDMSQTQFLRLSYCDQTLRFCYKDTGGNCNTLIYDIVKKRWLLDNYADPVIYHYLVEESDAADSTVPTQNQNILMLAYNNRVELAGGNTDDGADIGSGFLLPSMDAGDERTQKLYVDQMVQADGVGDLTCQVFYNNGELAAPTSLVSHCNGTIQQFIQSLSALIPLTLYRNIAARISWTGGPAGPRVYAWEYSGYAQPYLSSLVVTQYLSLSFPGWKHLRRLFPAIISTAPVLLTIRTQSGVSFPVTIPSTGGQFLITPQMMPQNIKDLAMSFQLDGGGKEFALFPDDFCVETKEWVEESYIKLAIFKT